jgi:hypothetical protein
VDKQSVAIVQNGENIATEKREDGAPPHIEQPGIAINLQPIDSREK